jgi:hypothetical protein
MLIMSITTATVVKAIAMCVCKEIHFGASASLLDSHPVQIP